MKHFLFVAAEMRVSVVFLCLLLDEVNILGFWTWSILQLHIEPLGTVTGNLFWIFHYRSPEPFFFYCSILKKKKKKVMCVTVIFFFMCQTRWKKKNSSWKFYFSQKKMFCVRHLFHVLFQWNDFLFWLKCFFLQCSFWPQEAEVHHRSAVSVTGGLLCFIGLFINVCQQWTVNHCNWEEGEESAYFWHRKRVVCFWDGGWRTRSNSSVPSALRMSATAVFLCLQRSHWLLHVSKLCMTISGDHQPGTSLENGSLRRKHYLF